MKNPLTVEKWRAHWCWPTRDQSLDLSQAFFRLHFEKGEVPSRFPIRISADSRYRFWINGCFRGRGPCKPSRDKYYYDEYDLSEDLREGGNLLAVEVRGFGMVGPESIMNRGISAFLFEGPGEFGIDTPGRWKCLLGGAVKADTTPYIANAHQLLGPSEIYDLAASPFGWELPEFDDSGWSAPQSILPAEPARRFGIRHTYWDLHPRPIPSLREETCFFKTISWNHGPAMEPPDEPIRIPPQESAQLILDAGALTTGFPQLKISGGEDRSLALRYCESPAADILAEADESDGPKYLKVHRKDWRNRLLPGFQDTLLPDGRIFEYEPMEWRTFWYLVLDISTGPTELIIVHPRYRFCSFPFRREGDFRCDSEEVNATVDISWRTFQLCSHETFEDCPYYEQLNYIFDARNEALISYALTGDDRLARHSLVQFRDTLRYDGMIQSRAPSRAHQRIPLFALWWIQMLYDFRQWVGPSALPVLRESLFSVEGILRWFEERRDQEGWIGPLPDWNPVGGTGAAGTSLPDAIETGRSIYVGLLYLQALDQAVVLYRAVGDLEDAGKWERRARALRQQLTVSAWCEEKGHFSEKPGLVENRVSQHTQVEAILAGVADAGQCERLLPKLMDEKVFTPMLRHQSLRLAEALNHIDRIDLLPGKPFDEFRQMLARGLSTCVEGRLDNDRSDCHAWSAWAPYALLTMVLGLRPREPGFKSLLVRPRFVFANARGTLPTPHGPAHLEWTTRPDEWIAISLKIPEGLQTELALPGTEPRILAEGGVLRELLPPREKESLSATKTSF